MKIIRGEFWSKYNKYDSQQRGLDTSGIANFIEDNLMAQPYSTKNVNIGFVPAVDLEAAIKTYINATGDSELSDIYHSFNEKRKLKELQEAVVKSLGRDFGYTEAQIGRFTKKNVYSERPTGIKNVSFKFKKTDENDQSKMPSNATFFQAKKEEEDMQDILSNWFEADPVIRSVQGYNRGK